MARQATRKDLRQLFKRLDDEGKQKLLNYGQQLANEGSSSGGSFPESLSKSGTPSYFAAADERMYNIEKRQIERGNRPDPR